MTITSRAFDPLRYAVVALTLLTAVIHLALNFPDPLFILNGVGYLGLLAALYLPSPVLSRHRGLIRWVLIAYTAVTIALWFFISPTSPLVGPFAFVGATLIAYVDKLAEVILIICLWIEGQR